MTIFNVISLFGGLSLFLYGMRIMGDGLKSSSAGALKRAMEKVTSNPLLGFFLGLIVTSIIQSSTASIVLTAGLVGSGIIKLRQSLGIILGANVGTTITGQIIRLLDMDSSNISWLNFFKPDTLAPVASVIGIILIMFLHLKNSKNIGTILMGFGILFTGLLTMTQSVSGLSESPAFANLFVKFSHNPVLGFAIGTGVACITQSSSATVGILQALSTTGVLSFSAVYTIIIGVNIGDCITTAIVCSIGSKADAKRVGLIHVIFNFFALILVISGIFILKQFGVLDGIWDTPITPGGIANANSIFRLSAAILLLPLTTLFEKLACKIIKDDISSDEEYSLLIPQIDEKAFASPALALDNATKSIHKMTNIAKNNFVTALECLNQYSPKAIKSIKENEDKLDILSDKTEVYLVALAPHIPQGELYDKLNFYSQCISEIERIGDHMSNLADSITEYYDNTGEFSDIANSEIKIVNDAVSEIIEYSVKAITKLDNDSAQKIEPLEEVIDDLVTVMRKKHIDRLRQGICTTDSGMYFLDMLTTLERVSDHCSNIGLLTLSLYNKQIMGSHHNYSKYLHSGKDDSFNEMFDMFYNKYFSKLTTLHDETITANS